MPDPAIDAAAGLFGGQQAAASNYQLTGVVAAGRDSAAIVVVDNGPPQTLKVGKEIVSGVRVQQVFPRFILLSDGRRVDIAQEVKQPGGAPDNRGGPPQAVQQFQPLPQHPPPQQFQQPQAAPIQVPQMPSMTGAPAPPPATSSATNVPPPNVVPPAPPVRGAGNAGNPGQPGQPVTQ
jgi:general secretion pathway protein C